MSKLIQTILSRYVLNYRINILINHTSSSMDLSDEESFTRQLKMSLPEAIEKNKLYMVDYTVILHNLICKNGMVRQIPGEW